ncbi:MAG: hypothetical protein P4L36_20630 [Holophaga sp.]|nr:hypothetical protein [Holophaga sp.]
MNPASPPPPGVLPWLINKPSNQSKLELIFPGHDVLMYDAYPKVAEGVTRLV